MTTFSVAVTKRIGSDASLALEKEICTLYLEKATCSWSAALESSKCVTEQLDQVFVAVRGLQDLELDELLPVHKTIIRVAKMYFMPIVMSTLSGPTRGVVNLGTDNEPMEVNTSSLATIVGITVGMKCVDHVAGSDVLDESFDAAMAAIVKKFSVHMSLVETFAQDLL